ncbi:MAG: DUF2065 domain-containing protein [Azoarcus sp.]|jgi:uncharacterized protein YjeT (DUF2065 family)|nr:DUF2065 domain-containing protein [Azoarcus sp.]
MGDTLLTAIALMLIFEGALPLLAPRVWREAFTLLTAMKDGQLRYVGLLAFSAGVLLFLLSTVWKR